MNLANMEERLDNLLSKPLEKVYTFSSKEEVIGFVKNLKESFHLTPFEKIIPLMEEEGVYDSQVKLLLDESMSRNSGCALFLNIYVLEGKLMDFDFLWYTTSAHLVHIGLICGEFILRLGTDESEYFYPGIAGMLGLVKKEFVGKTAEGRKVYRHSFREASSLDVYPLKGEDFFESWDDTEENQRKLVVSC